MGYFDYLISGPGDAFATIRRDNYAPDTRPTVINNSTNPFAGTITSVHDDGLTKTAIIDNVVQVQTVADRIFEQAKNSWSELWKDCTITAVVSILGGVALIGGTIALGIVFPPLLALAITVGILAVGIISAGGFVAYRASVAEDQLNAWRNPVEQAQQERVNIASGGFPYVKRHNLKGTYATQAETENLWHSNLANWKSRFASAQMNGGYATQSAVVTDFFANSPIDTSALGYAFTAIPMHYFPNPYGYSDLHGRFCAISSSSDARAYAVDSQALAEMRRINALADMNRFALNVASCCTVAHPICGHRRHHHRVAAGVTRGVTTALHIGNDVAQLAALGENRAARDYRIQQIEAERKQNLAGLFVDVKAMLDRYPN